MYKVALVGQVNVGKSSLFNRLISKSKALVSSMPGTTRDRNYDICSWQTKKFILIDTGGLINEKSEPSSLEREVEKQVSIAIKEADLLLFVLDVNEKISHFELKLSQIIKKSKKPFFAVFNKADSLKKRNFLDELKWQRLGTNQAYPVSAVTGIGTGDLLDEIIKTLESFGSQPEKFETSAPSSVKVAIFGKPNVGKSTLINRLIGEERVIVSNIPHTTREPQDILICHNEKFITLVDTAGVRRKRKIQSELEQTGVKKSIFAAQKADIIIDVFDVKETISHQDKSLLNLATETGKGLILVINKCDEISNFEAKFDKFIRYYQQVFAQASFAPIVFISAKTGKNVNIIFNLIEQVEKNSNRLIEKEELSEFFKKVISDKKFEQKVWKKIKISQNSAKPPTFNLKASRNTLKRKLINPAQINILEKEIRKHWQFEGTPIRMNLIG